MGHKITINEARLNSNYDRMMDELHMMFHVHPSNLTHVNLSPSELAQMAEADSYGRNFGASYHGPTWGGGSGSKCVRFADDGVTNGIPDKHR